MELIRKLSSERILSDRNLIVEEQKRDSIKGSEPTKEGLGTAKRNYSLRRVYSHNRECKME